MMKKIHIFCFFFIIAILIIFACSEKNTTIPTAPDKTDHEIGLLKPADIETTAQKPTVNAIHQKTRKPSIENLPEVSNDEKMEVESPSGYVWKIANWIIVIGGSQPTANIGAYSLSHDGNYVCKPIDFIYVSDHVWYRVPSNPKPKWLTLVSGEVGWSNWCEAYLGWIASYPVVWEAQAESSHSFTHFGLTIPASIYHPPVTIYNIRK